MNAVVVPYPKQRSGPRPVQVTCLMHGHGWWLVTWRGCSWLHSTKDEALINAHAIAAAHRAPVFEFGELA